MNDQEVVVLEEDEAPKNGTWVETCDLFSHITQEEATLGQEFGETIDTNDDQDGSDPDDGGLIRSFTGLSGAGDREKAFIKAKQMKEALLDFGVPEVSIELRPGRPNSHGSWDAGFWVSDMSHHTVSRYGTNKTPCLALCKFGRSDLPGPLCNGYGGWDLCYRIITFGYANHPGEGGPITLPALTAGRFTIPGDSARRYAWGTEWEGGLNAADWDKTLTNPRNGKKMNFREFMGRTNAALEEVLEIHRDAHMEHSTWTSRKIDRLHYDRARGIKEKMPYRRADERPRVDMSNIISEFRKALGIEKGGPTRRYGVAVIQRRLNRRYDAGLEVTGIVDKETLDAWEKHEKRIGIIHRSRVPERETLAALLKDTHEIGK